MVATRGDDAAGGAAADQLVASALARTRSALTGTIFAMSVLAYLGDHETGLGQAVVTVAGTGVVIFFAEAYAGLLSSSLAAAHRLRAGAVRHELRTCSAAAAPGLAAGLVLLLADLARLDVQVGIDVALWLGVGSLTVCSVVASRVAGRGVVVQVALVIASVSVGGVVILLKAALH